MGKASPKTKVNFLRPPVMPHAWMAPQTSHHRLVKYKVKGRTKGEAAAHKTQEEEAKQKGKEEGEGESERTSKENDT